MKTTFIARGDYRSARGFPVALTAIALGAALAIGCARRAPADGAQRAAADAASAADTKEARQRSAQEPCDSDDQCERGLVCEGCGDTGKICLQGCRADADCPEGEKCVQVQCVRCPCPPLCQ